MTYVEEILNNIFPGYSNIKETLETYSDYELSLVKDSIYSVDDVSSLNDYIASNVQFDIIEFLLNKIIDNGSILYNKEETTIMEYISSYNFLNYDVIKRAYKLSKQSTICMCEELIENADGNYNIIQDIDFKDIVYTLNTTTPLKFILDD